MTAPVSPSGYLKVHAGTVARTVECGSDVWVDVDADGQVLGVETIAHGDFYRAMYQALQHLKVAGVTQDGRLA